MNNNDNYRHISYDLYQQLTLLYLQTHSSNCSTPEELLHLYHEVYDKIKAEEKVIHDSRRKD